MRNKVWKFLTSLFIVGLLVGVSSPINTFPFISIKAEAASSRYNHNHGGFSCYKMSYYVSPTKTKQLRAQTNRLNTVTAIANFIGLSGLTAGIVSLVFGSAVSANNVFVNAANRGRGVQLSYIAHFSNTTSYNYSSSQNYVIK